MAADVEEVFVIIVCEVDCELVVCDEVDCETEVEVDAGTVAVV